MNRQEPNEARNRIKHIKDFTDYDERYDDYFRETIKRKCDEEREMWLGILKKERTEHNEEWWKNRRNGIVIMVNEGILNTDILSLLDYVERNYIPAN